MAEGRRNSYFKVHNSDFKIVKPNKRRASESPESLKQKTKPEYYNLLQKKMDYNKEIKHLRSDFNVFKERLDSLVTKKDVANMSTKKDLDDAFRNFREAALLKTFGIVTRNILVISK